VAYDPHLPHAARSFGLFAKAEALLHDPLNRNIEILTPVLPVALFTFGVTRSGLDLLALTPTTGTILLVFWLRLYRSRACHRRMPAGLGQTPKPPGLASPSACCPVLRPYAWLRCRITLPTRR
jgi:NhaA family Na+:H+ antiporter